jgi:hypothetical protein
MEVLVQWDLLCQQLLKKIKKSLNKSKEIQASMRSLQEVLPHQSMVIQISKRLFAVFYLEGVPKSYQMV